MAPSMHKPGSACFCVPIDCTYCGTSVALQARPEDAEGLRHHHTSSRVREHTQYQPPPRNAATTLGSEQVPRVSLTGRSRPGRWCRPGSAMLPSAAGLRQKHAEQCSAGREVASRPRAAGRERQLSSSL